MTVHRTGIELAVLGRAGEVLNQDGAQFTALAGDLAPQDLVEVGLQVPDLCEVLQPGHGVIGALQRVVGHVVITCTTPRITSNPGILPELKQSPVGIRQPDDGIGAVHMSRLRDAHLLLITA